MTDLLPDVDFSFGADLSFTDGIHASVDAEVDIEQVNKRARLAKQQALIERYAPRFVSYPVGLMVPAVGSAAFQFITDSPSESRRLEIRRFHLDLAQPINATEPGSSTVSVNQAGTGAASAITLTVPAVVGQINQVSGFTVSGTGATAGSTIVITLAGVQGGTQSFDYVVPAGAAVAAPTLEVNFNPPLLASGPNVAIVLTVPSFGAGNLNEAAELEAQSVISGGVTIYLVSDPGNVAGFAAQYLHSKSVIRKYTSLPIDDVWSAHAAVVYHPENLYIVATQLGSTPLQLAGNIQTTDFASDMFNEPTMTYHILQAFNTEL